MFQPIRDRSSSIILKTRLCQKIIKNLFKNATNMDQLKVTDEIVDDIKDSIECHLGWFSTKIKVKHASKRYQKLLRSLPLSSSLP